MKTKIFGEPIEFVCIRHIYFIFHASLSGKVPCATSFFYPLNVFVDTDRGSFLEFVLYQAYPAGI